MKVWTNSFETGGRIPEKNAFGKPDAKGHMALSDNVNPHVAWSQLPAATRSLVLICHDPDVPSRADDVNQEGRVVASNLSRVDFFHWVLVDVAGDAAPLEEGEFSKGVTPRGKSGPSGPRGTRQGANDYTGFLAADASMNGTYFGYDGPCPPWNDEIVHHYHFTLYATDFDRCPVEGTFTGKDVLRALQGHILAEASFMGTYALNPRLL